MHVLDFTAPESRDGLLHRICQSLENLLRLTGLQKRTEPPCLLKCAAGPSHTKERCSRWRRLRDITEHKQAEEALQKAREELEARVERQMERGNPYGLTFRELTVLHVVAAGKADKEIAGQLGISHSDGQQAPREHPQQDGGRLPHRGRRARPPRRTLD